MKRKDSNDDMKEGQKIYKHDVANSMVGKKIVVHREGTKNGLVAMIPIKLTINKVSGNIVVCKNSNGDDFNISIEEAYMYFSDKH